MRRTSLRHVNHVLRGYVATDIAALCFGVLGAWLVAALINSIYLDRSLTIADIEPMRAAGFVTIAAFTLLWFQLKGHYRVRINFWLELKHVSSAVAIAMLVDGFLQYAAKHDFSRLWLVTSWLFAGIAILSLRALYRRHLRRTGKWRLPSLLVGGGHTAADTRAALASESGLGYDIIAQVTNLPEAFLRAGRSWDRLCAEHGVDYVLLALDGAEYDQAAQPIHELTRDGIAFSISPPRRNLPVLDMVPQYFFNHDVKLLTFTSGLEQPLPRLIKRAFDIAVSGIALLVASVPMLALALLVRRDGGRAFYGHTRIGMNGTRFQCLKFRSMIVGSDAVLARHLAENADARAEWEADHKLKNDPRVTGVGRFLRATSLDELPQLLNVLRGEMSLVGPRPIVGDEIAKYEGDIAYYYRVRPGITGLWQVSGRNDVSYAQRVQMDAWYVRNWSLWHDIAILCKTIPALMKRSGAY